MKSRKPLVGGALVVAVVAALAIWGVPGQGDGEAPGAIVSPGMVTHIDPETGQTIAAPGPGQADEPGGVANTSAEGLVEEPSPVPGGGVMVDLQGRFQNAAIVTGDTDSVKVECVPDSQAARAAEGGDER